MISPVSCGIQNCVVEAYAESVHGLARARSSWLQPGKLTVCRLQHSGLFNLNLEQCLLNHVRSVPGSRHKVSRFDVVGVEWQPLSRGSAGAEGSASLPIYGLL